MPTMSEQEATYNVTPARSAAAVTPHNTNALSATSRALYIGGAGDIKIDLADSGSAITFVGVPAGTILPVQATRVYSTGTTATSIVALF